MVLRRAVRLRIRKRIVGKTRIENSLSDAIQLCLHLSQSPTTGCPLPCRRVGPGDAGYDRREECQEGQRKNGCSSVHDIKKYLEHVKKLDLDGVCTREERGAGWRCRWLKSHT